MGRKLVEQGGTTLMVSLPSRWVKQFSLKKGDEVDVEESGKDILVSVNKDSSIRDASVDISGMSPMIKRILGAFYKVGYDQISISFETAEELREAQEVISQEFVGFEIVEQNKKSLVTRRISSIEHSEFETTMRRLFMFMLSTGDDILAALKQGNIEELKLIIPRDININKLCVFCRRSLNRRGYNDARKTNLVYYIVEELEKIGDAYKEMCNDIVDNNVKLGKDAISAVANVNRFLRDFYEIYYSFDMGKIVDFGNKSKELEKQLISVYSAAGKKEYKAIFCLELIKNMCFDMNGALIAINI